MRYTMMQVCKETGMTYQALKFYCNEGLVATKTTAACLTSGTSRGSAA